MASGILTSFGPAGAIRPSVASAERRSDGRGRKAGGSVGKWWTPLFGWAPEADYIEPSSSATKDDEVAAGEGQNRQFTRKFSGLTEEKARELRKRTVETETFHDVMYHSAIASRLASDLERPRS